MKTRPSKPANLSPYSRTYIIATQLLIILSCLGAAQAAALPASPPNVIVILVDDLGYGDLSSYGASDLKTPHIDRLINSGMRFDNFYANCPVCSPTRAALLSGKYPDRVGVPGVIRTRAQDSWGFLDPKAVLLPKALWPASYHTAIVGKWHLGLTSPSTPNEMGFDHFHGFLGDMMDDYYNHRRQGNNYMFRNDVEIDPPGHATDLFSNWAIDYLNERKADDRRFFLYLAYNAPHTPIQPPTHWLAKVKNREPNISEKRASLVALIEHMDHGIGKVMAALQENGQAEETVVIFTSDNGGQLNVGGQCGNNRGGKQDMYEGGIRVPAGVVWPGVIPPGSRSDIVGMTMDIYPTVCEIAGTTYGKDLNGVSLLPTLLGRQQKNLDRPLVWVRREGNMRYQGRDYFALRDGPWKLVQNSPFERYQLYNLDTDPLESTDLAKSEGGRYRALIQKLMSHIQSAGQVPWQTPTSN